MLGEDLSNISFVTRSINLRIANVADGKSLNCVVGVFIKFSVNLTVWNARIGYHLSLDEEQLVLC